MMKRGCVLIVSIISIVLCGLQTLAASDVPKAVLDCCDSVVRIETIYDDGFGTGSGFVVSNDDEQTLILTNHHVGVEGNPNGIYVILNEETDIPATVIASDKNMDLALLKVSYPLGMKPLILSGDSAKKGDAIYVIGFPGAADSLTTTFAATQDDSTITDGIVSAVREFDINSNGNPVEILQLNAAINFGNSGGPIVGKNGRVVGISTFSVDDAQGVFGGVSVSAIKDFLDANGIVYKTHQVNFAYVIVGVIALAIIVGLVLILVRRRKNFEEKTQEWTFVTNNSNGCENNTENVKAINRIEIPWKKIGLGVGIVAVVLLLAAYGLSFVKVEEYADRQDFEKAYNLMVIKPINKLVNEELFTYVDAGVTMNHGNYEIAAPVFESLGEYKDSIEMHRQCMYQEALKYIGADNEKAIEILTDLHGYLDSDEKWKEIMYSQAMDLKNNNCYSQAYPLFVELSNMYYKDSWDNAAECKCQICIDEYRKDGNYANALKELEELEKHGSDVATETIQKIKSDTYDKAVAYYRSGTKLNEAKSMFNAIKPYKRAGDYAILLDCKSTLSGYYSPEAAKRVTIQLKRLIGLEDAAELLMKDHDVAWEYLQGTWYSYDRAYNIKCTRDNFDTNLPGDGYGQVYIEDGIMYFWKNNDAGNKEKWLQLTVEEEDMLKVVCYKAKYNMPVMMYREY